MLDGGVMTVRAEVHTSAAPAAIGPYSQGVRASGFVFTSGQIGADPSDGAMVDGVAAQADRALRNLAAVLSEAGSSLERVVKTTIFLTDMNDFAAVNEIYASYFTEPYPARATVQVARLPKDVRVEIDAIAVVG
jgi:2-iminobutanoate/2-iminopropanoate deaminase